MWLHYYIGVATWGANYDKDNNNNNNNVDNNVDSHNVLNQQASCCKY